MKYRPFLSTRRTIAATALLLGATSTLTVGGGLASASASTSPIVVGSLNALSGAATFPEASGAARAVFDQVNASGGIDGRKIRYVTEDDKSDPATAATDARQLVGSDGAVALVGGMSLIECSTNAAYYAQQKIDVIDIGIEPQCFNSPNIAPTNVGPAGSTTAVLYYASQVLKAPTVCAFLVGQPNGATYESSVKSWESITGKSAKVEVNIPFNAQDSLAPYVVQAKGAGCSVFVTNVTEARAQVIVQAMADQKIHNMPMLDLSPLYQPAAAKAIGKSGIKVIVQSEFEPFTIASDKATASWRALMTKYKVAMDPFSEGGAVAAEAFVSVLRGIHGTIDRSSVRAALTSMHPFQSPLVGSPYVFGPGSTHQPNTSSKFLTVTGTTWTVLTHNWVRLPVKK